MTRSIKQSRTCAPIQSGTAGPSVTQYATVAELITASQGGLAPGYYEVPGVWVTYWDGAVFSPTYDETRPFDAQFFSANAYIKAVRHYAELISDDITATDTFASGATYSRAWP